MRKALVVVGVILAGVLGASVVRALGGTR